MYTYHDLVKSPVEFEEDAHLYFDENGAPLTGVTQILKEVLFPDKYDGVPQAVLMAAAKKGSDIHTLCNQIDLFPDAFDLTTYPPEVAGYDALKKDNGINTIANEYLVALEDKGIASSIDMVDDEYNLYDIKTTYSLDKYYLSWQLSFYAYMFDRQNPAARAGKLYGIWLRGEKAELVEVERKTDAQIEEVITAWKDGRTLTQATDDLSEVVRIEAQIQDLKQALKDLEEVKAAALAPLTEKMAGQGLKSMENDCVKITIIADSVTRRLDSKKLEKDHPDLYSQYSSESVRKGYTKVTLK